MECSLLAVARKANKLLDSANNSDDDVSRGRKTCHGFFYGLDECFVGGVKHNMVQNVAAV